jgi:integrase/recombinase XerD
LLVLLLTDLLDEYLMECQIKGYSKLTVKHTGFNIQKFITETGLSEVETVRPTHIKQYIVKRQESGIKAVTINTQLKHIRCMYKYGISEGILSSSPFDRISFLKEQKPMIKTYTTEDIMQIIYFFSGKDFLSIRNKTMMMTFIETGIRSSELRNIRVDDVYEDSIRITGKGNKVRFVAISLPLRKQLIRYQRSRNSVLGDKNCEWYFISKSGKYLKVTAMKHIIEKFNILKLPVKPTFHNFRRFYTQQMLEHTDLYTVSRLLGHSDVITTQRYVNTTEDKVIIKRGMNSPLSNM